MVIYQRLLPIKLVLGGERYGVSGPGQSGPIFSLKADSAKYLEVDVNTAKSKAIIRLLKDKYNFEKRDPNSQSDSEIVASHSLKSGFNFLRIGPASDPKLPE